MSIWILVCARLYAEDFKILPFKSPKYLSDVDTIIIHIYRIWVMMPRGFRILLRVTRVGVELQWPDFIAVHY